MVRLQMLMLARVEQQLQRTCRLTDMKNTMVDGITTSIRSIGYFQTRFRTVKLWFHRDVSSLTRIVLQLECTTSGSVVAGLMSRTVATASCDQTVVWSQFQSNSQSRGFSWSFLIRRDGHFFFPRKPRPECDNKTCHTEGRG